MEPLRIESQIDVDLWSDFVKNHPNGNVFQTPEMYNVFKATKNYTPVLLAAINSEGKIQGILLSVIQSEYSNPLGSFTARAIVWGGPLVEGENTNVLRKLLVAFDKEVKSKAIYTQFRNFWVPVWERSVFESLGFEYEDHLNILVDLSKSADQLWKEVKSARRKAINKAKRSGVIFKELSEDGELQLSYSIIEAVYKNAKLPYPHISLFQSAFSLLDKKGMVKFFGAFHNEKLIGTRVVLCYKEYVFDWYAGSLQEHYTLRPNDLLPWEVFLWGKGNGYNTFDFGGAGSPHVPYGVRDYKMKFCSDLINPGRFQKVHKPILMNIGKAALSIYKKIK